METAFVFPCPGNYLLKLCNLTQVSSIPGSLSYFRKATYLCALILNVQINPIHGYYTIMAICNCRISSDFKTFIVAILQASDNTRHLARNPKTGESYMVAPEDMQRVVLCSGAIYYHLSNARRQRKIRNIALVRLEQLAPFPHDLLIQVCLLFKFFSQKIHPTSRQMIPEMELIL